MISSRKKILASEVNLEDKVVAVNRVTKVVKGGRNFSFSAIVVVGDGNGVVGHGLGKANEVVDAIAKGIEDAKKNLIRIPIAKGTVPHVVKGKHAGGAVLLKPAAPGTGIIAGGGVRTVLESAGIKNILSKSQGSTNPHNVVKATIQALLQLRDPRTVAMQRGITLEQVFNG